IDMLPRELGEDLCSINSNVDRYAFSVLWEVTPPVEDLESKLAADAANNTSSKQASDGKNSEVDEAEDDGLGVKVIDVSFHKTIIRSRANLSYGDAQYRIDDLSQQDPLTVNLRVLNRISKVLKRRRLAAGA